jgi:hypothetical protein
MPGFRVGHKAAVESNLPKSPAAFAFTRSKVAMVRLVRVSA